MKMVEHDDLQIIRERVFSVKGTYCLNGSVNRQNCRFVKRHTQYPQSVNVWAAIAGDTIALPFLLTLHWTMTNIWYNITYQQLQLYTHVIKILTYRTFHQQVGAPRSYVRDVAGYIYNIVCNRWIGQLDLLI